MLYLPSYDKTANTQPILDAFGILFALLSIWLVEANFVFLKYWTRYLYTLFCFLNGQNENKVKNNIDY